MSKLINDSTFGKSVILAKGREKRPSISLKDENHQCPFCTENRALLEHIWLEGPENMKIVNNKYPFCDEIGELYGIHDVVIDTGLHEEEPKDFSYTHWYELLKLMQKRWHLLANNPRINMIQIFKNNGKAAGASIAHSHWQIVGLEQIPLTKQMSYDTFDREGTHCSLCTDGKHTLFAYPITENKSFLAISPEFSQFPYETWIVTKEHVRTFGALQEEVLRDLGKILKDLLVAYAVNMPGVAYNICFMEGPLRTNENYHFFIKILPRAGNFAGFELATGCFINPMNPEQHTDKMKRAIQMHREASE